MSKKIESASPPRNLVQQLVQEVLSEAGKRIAAIDSNRGIIAECESLAAAIRKAGGFKETSEPLVTVHETHVHATVFIAYVRLSAIRDAIRDAGLHVFEEQTVPTQTLGDSLIIKLVGFDCEIHTHGLVKELAEAA